MSRPIPALCLTLFLLAPTPAWAGAAAISLSGYAEMHYSHFDHGPDQKSGENGAPEDSRATIDLARFVFELGYDFSPSLEFEAEVEFEHGGTGAATELEYEEFGEYETEVEKGGEVALEQIHLTKSFSRAANLRLGHFLVAVGAATNCHQPSCYFSNRRPEAESSMVPVSWHESGVEFFGRWRRLQYRAQVVNGLDSSGFSSKFWARDGHQQRFEQVRATDLAGVLRLDYRIGTGSRLGGALYYGDTTGNRPKPDMEGIDAALTLLSFDFRSQAGPILLRGSGMWGHLQNADRISSKNSRLSTELGVARTPVARRAQALALEAGVELLHWWWPDTVMALYPFARWERVDTMHTVDSGVFDDPRFDRSVWTGGIDWFVAPDVVFKADYSIRSFGASRLRNEKTFSLGLGFTLG